MSSLKSADFDTAADVKEPVCSSRYADFQRAVDVMQSRQKYSLISRVIELADC